LEVDVFFRQLLHDETGCASYLFGCLTHSRLAVVEPHVDLLDKYVAMAEAQAAPIVAVFDTHVQADHVSGLPELVARTGATAYLPEGTGVEFEHHPLADGEIVKLGNTDTTERFGETWIRVSAGTPTRRRPHTLASSGQAA
jgi:hydroxyacylglutathione hydrolase